MERERGREGERERGREREGERERERSSEVKTIPHSQTWKSPPNLYYFRCRRHQFRRQKYLLESKSYFYLVKPSVDRP